MGYDQAAASYDGLFTRPVDRWEDEQLAGLLGPLVTGRAVLDLGCGTGWLLDHCVPLAYTGADASGPMLAELGRKHPYAVTAKTEVGAEGWHHAIRWPRGGYDVITATWSLEYLGDLGDLLGVLRALSPRAVIALHGSTPRGHRRAHFSVKEVPWEPLSPLRVTSAGWRAGYATPRCVGTSALPDALMGLGHWAFRAALGVPAGWHYSALWVWQP